MKNEQLAALAETRLQSANDTYNEARDTSTQLSLLLLALAVKETFPTCKTVRLEISDQGQFMSVDGADFLDEDGREANTDDQARINFYEDVEVAYAWNLDQRDPAWTQHTTDGAATFDVDTVIGRLRSLV